MSRSRLFDDPRRMDLHWDDSEPPGDSLVAPERTSGGLNEFPPLEHTVQRTERAVYVLARGLGVSLSDRSAAAARKWFTRHKHLKIDRDGPSRFPGPDGTQYEWFFRVSGVDGQPSSSVDTLFGAVRARLRPSARPTSVPAGYADLDFLALEQVRADTYLVEEMRRLQRTRAGELRARLFEQRSIFRNPKASTASDQEAVESLLAEAIARDSRVNARADQLDEKERNLVAREQWLSVELEKARRRSASASGEIDLAALQRLFPRLVLDRDTAAVLEIELNDNAPYLRLLAALQDRVPMSPDTYPPCKKHLRLDEVPGSAWWEIRLRDSVASDYRLIYRMMDEERLEVHIVFRRDAQRFFDALK